MCKPDFIRNKYGRIKDYVENTEHKYFVNAEKGITSDDWQLTKAIAESIIDTGNIDLDSVAKYHVKEYNKSVRGWGGSTRESVERLAKGCSWRESGISDKDNRGLGNGICMKVSPIALYIYLSDPEGLVEWTENIEKVADIAAMTHRTSIGVSSGLSHIFATLHCLNTFPSDLSDNQSRSLFYKSFSRMIISGAQVGRQYYTETLNDDIQTRFERLKRNLKPQDIIEEFGGGSCYVFDSLPFTYAWFLNNPDNIESLYDCISAGGDSDSNGSMLGGLLGAIHGENIFPQHLVDGLKDKDEVLALADAFYDRFITDEIWDKIPPGMKIEEE